MTETMTIHAAVQLGIARLTREEWGKGSWVELHLVTPGNGERYMGPWVDINTPPFPAIQVLATELPEFGWIPYTGE